MNSYDARERATRPDLCPAFMPPPDSTDEEGDDAEAHPAADPEAR